MKLINICPHCRKPIPWNARRCPHCISELPEGGVNPTFFSGKRSSNLIMAGAACLLIWYVLTHWYLVRYWFSG
jgi:hypothetical protein